MIRPAKISAVILAGGESRRMGRDKATLEFRGQTLWQNQLALLQELSPVEIFISSRTDPLWRPNDTIFVADRPPACGPLGGVLAALEKTRGTHLLVLAIDLPLMTTEYLQLLCQQVVEGRGVVPMIGDRAEPLVAIYPIAAITDFETAIHGTDHSLQSVVTTLAQSAKVDLLPVVAEDKKLFRNLNSPND